MPAMDTVYLLWDWVQAGLCALFFRRHIKGPGIGTRNPSTNPHVPYSSIICLSSLSTTTMFFSKNLLVALLVVAAVGVNGAPVSLGNRAPDQESGSASQGDGSGSPSQGTGSYLQTIADQLKEIEAHLQNQGRGN